MNTYRTYGRFVATLLLIVFIFAASQPVKSETTIRYGRATFQGHLENLAVGCIPNWQASMLHVKSPLIGTTWDTRAQARFLKGVNAADTPDISIHGFSYFFIIPTINAP